LIRPRLTKNISRCALARDCQLGVACSRAKRAQIPSTNCQAAHHDAAGRPRLPVMGRHAMLTHRNKQGRGASGTPCATCLK
jgi:hypothetical protein